MTRSRSLPARPQSLRDDLGLNMVEVSIALGIMAAAVIGLAGAMTLGVAAAGQAKQRSVAGALAAERLEGVHELPFGQIALVEQPTHTSDPSDPDHAISMTGTYYEVTPGSQERLVVDTAHGALHHAEGPLTRGNTQTTIHQYVTWVDDPSIVGAEDYKRVTVVVDITQPMQRGVSARTTFSTFIGHRGVVVQPSTPSPSTPSPAPTPAPTASPAASCAGDTVAPTGSMAILSGAGADAGYTNSLTVQMQLQASDACPDLRVLLSNDGIGFTDVTALSPGVPSTVTWTIPGGDGTKTVRMRFVDGAQNTSPTYQASVEVDQTPPTAPSGLWHASCGMNSSDRVVTLTWPASSDVHLSGYRLYRSINDGGFESVTTTSTTSAGDTSKKSEASVRYIVKAYDRAGNESADSSQVTYARNSC